MSRRIMCERAYFLCLAVCRRYIARREHVRETCLTCVCCVEVKNESETQKAPRGLCRAATCVLRAAFYLSVFGKVNTSVPAPTPTPNSKLATMRKRGKRRSQECCKHDSKYRTRRAPRTAGRGRGATAGAVLGPSGRSARRRETGPPRVSVGEVGVTVAHVDLVNFGQCVGGELELGRRPVGLELRHAGRADDDGAHVLP